MSRTLDAILQELRSDKDAEIERLRSDGESLGADFTALLRSKQEADVEIERLRGDFAKLSLLIANMLDEECSNAEWSDICDSFDPWNCVRMAAQRIEKLKKDNQYLSNAVALLQMDPSKALEADDE
jgi:hypothetical protein